MVYDTTANRAAATAKNYFCSSDDSANCSDAYTAGALKTGFVKGSSFVDKQLALVACPQDEEQCTPAGKTKTFANKDAAAIELSMKAQAYTDICSFLIEATCDAPYVHIKDNGDQSASLGKMSFSIIEYDPSFTTVNLDPATAFTNAQGAPAARKTDVAKYLKQDTKLKKNTVFNNKQGQLGDISFKIISTDANNLRSIPAFMVKESIAKKKAEFTSFETAKAAYNTKKTAYEATKKKIAEANAKRGRDYFAKIFPSAEDQKLLKEIPDKPSKPTQPSAYKGPAIDDANLFSSWAGATGGFGIPTITEIKEEANFPNLYAGKSFGVVGQGTNTGTAATVTAASADIGKFTNLAVSPAEKSAAGACQPHYMIITGAPRTKDTASYSAVTLVSGAKAFTALNLDDYKAPTQPTAAADPSPQTGSQYLRAAYSLFTAWGIVSLI